MNRRVVAALGATALFVSGALAACTPPSGGRVGVTSSGTLVFTAQSGKANDVLLTTDSAGNLVLSDIGDRVIAGSGCTQVGNSRVLCPAAGVARIAMNLLDGDDSALNETALPTSSDGIQGGPGDDILTGGSGSELIVGDEGSDRMEGGPGNDVLRDAFSGSATDVVDADVFIGGAGTDFASYGSSVLSATVGVTADLDGVADDGQPGEGDEIRTDIEGLQGTALGSDTLVGSAGPNVMEGLGGTDTVRGGGGNDYLRGNSDADVLEGGEGDDTLRGGPGFDGLNGGRGIDDCDVEADGGTESACEV